MLQVPFIRKDPAFVKQRLEVKQFRETHLVDEVLMLDDQRKKHQQELDNFQAKINTLSKEIGQLMAKGQKDEAENRKQEVAFLKNQLSPASEALTSTEKQLLEVLLRLPNLPAEKVRP